MNEDEFRKLIVWSVLLPLVLVCLPALGADTGEISVTVREAGTLAPLPCRAWVTVGNKRLFEPAPGSCTSYVKDRSFSCDGQFVVKAPAGKAVIHVERGKEYWPVDKEIVVKEDRTAEVEITLRRWVHMLKEGWYSGDIHCHFGLNDLRVLKQLALAGASPTTNVYRPRPFSKKHNTYTRTLHEGPRKSGEIRRSTMVGQAPLHI